MVSYRWSLETVTLSRVIAEILCDKHLGEHIPIENALIAIFWPGGLGVTAFYNFMHIVTPKARRLSS